MKSFKPSKILSVYDIIAEQLRNARQEKDVKLKDVAKKINIKYEYLKALETGELEKLPPGVYRKNFLKEYAIFLGLDSQKILKDFVGDETIAQDDKKLVRRKSGGFFSKQIIKSHNFLIVPKIVKSIVVVIIILICFLYLGFYLKNIFSSPQLKIIEPQNNLTINHNFIDVIGEVETEVEVTINGELIPLDQGDGDNLFTKRINLKIGINTIVITAKKKYGRNTTITRQILVQDFKSGDE